MALSLRTATRDLEGSGLTANRANQFNASGLYPAFDALPCLPDPRFARDLCSPTFPHLAGALMHDLLVAQQCCTSLTQSAEGDFAWPPDAAPTGKTQKLSKNDYGFTPSISPVNGKNQTLCALDSAECSWSTGVCSKTGAARNCRNASVAAASADFASFP